MEQSGLLSQLTIAENQEEKVGIKVAGVLWCNEMRSGESFYRGEYFNVYEEWVAAKFLAYVPNSSAEQDQLLKIPSPSFRNVIKAKVAHTIEDGIIIGYEPFDDTFLSWINKKRIQAFTSTESDLHWWWKEAALDIVEAMDDIHDQNRFHGGMHNDNSYVIVGNKLKLINVGIGDSSTMDKEARKQEDCRAFLEFLNRHVHPIHNSYQWGDFMGSFEEDELKQSKNLPMFLKSSRRSDYLRRIIDFYNNDLIGEYPDRQPVATKKAVFEEIFTSPEGQLPYDWKLRLPRDPYLNYVYTHNLKRRFKGLPIKRHTLHLLQFLEVVIDHFGDPPLSSVPCPSQGSRDDLENKFSTCFPGYLTKMHRLLVRYFPTHSITRVNP